MRKRLADAQGVPPYIVFGDATLIQMARDKPMSEGNLLGVIGVGQHKLEKYGKEFLDAITEYSLPPSNRESPLPVGEGQGEGD